MLPCSISLVSLDAQLNVKVLYWFVLHLYSKNYNKCLLQRYYSALLQRYYKGLYRVITDYYYMESDMVMFLFQRQKSLTRDEIIVKSIQVHVVSLY